MKNGYDHWFVLWLEFVLGIRRLKPQEGVWKMGCNRVVGFILVYWKKTKCIENIYLKIDDYYKEIYLKIQKGSFSQTYRTKFVDFFRFIFNQQIYFHHFSQTYNRGLLKHPFSQTNRSIIVDFLKHPFSQTNK